MKRLLVIFAMILKNCWCQVLGIGDSDDSFTFVNKIRFPFSNTEGPFIGLEMRPRKCGESPVAMTMAEIRRDDWLSMPQMSGIFVAISTPLVEPLPNYNMFFSYNFEANYNLPQNETTFTFPPLVTKRSWDRKFFYEIFEAKMERNGYPGKKCMLRAICEAALYSLQHTGVLGDLFHIILTPSSSVNPNMTRDYEKAEQRGKFKKSCAKYKEHCDISFIDLISWETRLLIPLLISSQDRKTNRNIFSCVNVPLNTH